MTKKQKAELLHDCIFEYERRENDFPVVSDSSEIMEGYRGIALHINDHGNVTLLKCFKNGNTREIASIV